MTLPADATLDRTTNISDFNRLATNYGATGKLFGQGDFNYDATVNIQDFNILATTYNQTLSAVGGSAAFGDSGNELFAAGGVERRDRMA